MADGPDTAGVIAPPRIILLVMLVCGLGLDFVFRLDRFVPSHDAALRTYLGGVMIALTVVIMTFSVRGFRLAGTPVPTSQPTKQLVTSGVHGISRNPIYVAFFIFYFGIALLTASLGLLALFPIFALVIRFGVVAREEAYLEAKFGDTYTDYRSRVPRWL